MNEKIELVPISEIRILNPRHRDPVKFEVIVESIRELGLKKPIRVSRRTADEEGGEGYDLVCGQGRIEAFVKLGWTKIPAIVGTASKEDRLVMSLVENMARKFPKPLDLIHEVLRLKARNYSNAAISRKIGVQEMTISGLLVLWTSGEERLLEATLMGKIPLGIGLDIARVETKEEQREILKAYQEKKINQQSIRAMRRILEQRRLYGKSLGKEGRGPTAKRTTADSIVNSYRKEAQKQKAMIKRHQICETKLVFVTSALRSLLDDKAFCALLLAEQLDTMPKFLYQQVQPA